MQIAARALRDDNLETRVIDTGIGIKEEDMYKLFAPFQQIGMSLTMKHEGTGLGLYILARSSPSFWGVISRRRANMAGGRVYLYHTTTIQVATIKRAEGTARSCR